MWDLWLKKKKKKTGVLLNFKYSVSPQEELDASVQADVKRQLGPKRPLPKEIIPAEKLERCLKNLSRGPPQPPVLPDDYDRVLEKTISQEKQEKEAAYRLKRG